MEADRLELFEANRRRLFGLAYRLLGDATEAEDVVPRSRRGSWHDVFTAWFCHETGPAGSTRVRRDVVPSRDHGGAASDPWALGAFALLLLAGMVLRRRDLQVGTIENSDRGAVR